MSSLIQQAIDCYEGENTASLAVTMSMALSHVSSSMLLSDETKKKLADIEKVVADGMLPRVSTTASPYSSRYLARRDPIWVVQHRGWR